MFEKVADGVWTTARPQRFFGVETGTRGAGWMERFSVKDWKQGRREVDRMLAWDIERIVLTHGEMISSDGKRVLRDAYAWL